MIKILHVIKAGNCVLTDFEKFCIGSWKKVYPDWEIKYWDTDNNLDLIEDCEFAQRWFKEGGKGLGYVVDYIRLKVLYLYGGMVLDTDVIANKRIPNKYFRLCLEKVLTI